MPSHCSISLCQNKEAGLLPNEKLQPQKHNIQYVTLTKQFKQSWLPMGVQTLANPSKRHESTPQQIQRLAARPVSSPKLFKPFEWHSSSTNVGPVKVNKFAASPNARPALLCRAWVQLRLKPPFGSIPPHNLLDPAKNERSFGSQILPRNWPCEQLSSCSLEARRVTMPVVSPSTASSSGCSWLQLVTLRFS